MIEITENKVERMSTLVEDMLLAGGKLMSCLEKLSGEMYGDRRNSRDDDRMDMRYGNRMDRQRRRDDWDDDDYDMMGERRYSRMRR